MATPGVSATIPGIFSATQANVMTTNPRFGQLNKLAIDTVQGRN